MGKIYKNGIEYGGGGGGSAGHIILDNDGTAMAEEPNLQFKGLNVTDNSTDEITEVESAGLNQDSMDDVLNASIPGNQVASNGLVYSTTEQIIGKWINGKPLYQKTVQYNSYLGAMNVINTFTPPSDIDNLVDVDMTILGRDGSTSPSKIIPTSMVTYYIRTSDGLFVITQNGYSDAGTSTYGMELKTVTYKYTKTTD